MSEVTISFNKTCGRIKPMHAVNNGPIKADSVEQTRSNFDAFKAAKIPYVRNHDASHCSAYGGEHTVDVHAIFPDFNRNPYEPDSYDFALTDEYLETIIEAGSKVYYRLGSKIEHWCKKYGTVVPPDFHKWAVVCEHIIRHYTDGWANGFHYDIEYWEIWNEPDGVKANGDQPNWSGTPLEFYELFTETATHLKSRFPNLKIGGPAVSWAETPWLDGLLDYITKDGRHVPMDFLGFHVYSENPDIVGDRAEYIRKKLDSYGYTEAECHLNEFNYLLNFTTRYVESIEGIISIRGAAFTAAAMSIGQASPLDMLMYYDARVNTVFNGMFDLYTLRPIKGYYPFLYFSALYELGNQAESHCDAQDVHVTAASDGDSCAAMLTYYPMEGDEIRQVTVSTDKGGDYRVRLTDGSVTNEERIVTAVNGSLTFDLKPNSILLMERI